MYKNLLCVSLVFFALTGSTLAALTKCYYCDGLTAVCNDPVDVSKLTTCTVPTANMLQSPGFNKFNLTLKSDNLTPVSASEGFTCAKVVASIEALDYVTTMRLCSYAKIDDKDTCTFLEEQFKGTEGVELTCNTCDTDLCNSASSVAISLLSFVGLFVLLALN